MSGLTLSRRCQYAIDRALVGRRWHRALATQFDELTADSVMSRVWRDFLVRRAYTGRQRSFRRRNASTRDDTASASGPAARGSGSCHPRFFEDARRILPQRASGVV